MIKSKKEIKEKLDSTGLTTYGRISRIVIQ
jgi:hypothetical protein